MVQLAGILLLCLEYGAGSRVVIALTPIQEMVSAALRGLPGQISRIITAMGPCGMRISDGRLFPPLP
jgi:hypothetical protein